MSSSWDYGTVFGFLFFIFLLDLVLFVFKDNIFKEHGRQLL